MKKLYFAAQVITFAIPHFTQAQEAMLRANKARAQEIVTNWKHADAVTAESLSSLAGKWTLSEQLKTDPEFSLEKSHDRHPHLEIVVGDIVIPAHQTQVTTESLFLGISTPKTVDVPEAHFAGKINAHYTYGPWGTYHFLLKQKGIVFMVPDVFNYTRNCRFSSLGHELICRLRDEYEDGSYEVFVRTNELLPPATPVSPVVPAPTHDYPCVIEDQS